MADNVYLLETRLSRGQQSALEAIRLVARQQGLTVFLVGGAVRDLMSGSPVRDLDVVVQGDALTLRSQLEQIGAQFSGQSVPLRSLYVRFPTGVRVEVGSTLAAAYPKPGKPVYQQTTILEDLRRRDFTANAMAISLNEGSYGLLMDPLNGVADIENRELRLVSNYGFLEDPSRLVRAARLMARLGWQMDERTRKRYETAKEENYITAWQSSERGYELEELFHEEEPLRVMRRLEEEGWLSHLSPILSVGKVNVSELGRLRDSQMQLETRGIRADASAANFPLLTAKIAPSDVESLKKSFPRSAFVAEINQLEASAKELANQLSSKALALPSEAYKLLQRSDPIVVLWTVHTSKNATLQARYKSFLTEWPQAQQRIPVLLMVEMRITPDLPGYEELQETLFYALMDGHLSSPEEMRAFLEPYSPPAPPPPVSLRRPRTPRKEAKATKSRKKVVASAEKITLDETAAGPGADNTEAIATAQPREAVFAAKAMRAEKIKVEEGSAKLVSAKKKMTNSKATAVKQVAASAPAKRAKPKQVQQAAPATKVKARKVSASATPRKPTKSSVPTKSKARVPLLTKQRTSSPPAKVPLKKSAGKKVAAAKGPIKKAGVPKKPALKKALSKKAASKRR